MTTGVRLDDSELELAAQALRALAVRYRNDAKRPRNPMVRESFENSAAECERLAQRIIALGVAPHALLGNEIGFYQPAKIARSANLETIVRKKLFALDFLEILLSAAGA